jgi:hypothetical protein
MNTTDKHNERIAVMSFATVYPLYVTKIEKKGRSEEELNQVIEWLCGYDAITNQQLIDENLNFQQFIERDKLNPNANLITGMICGYRIEELENTLTRQVRYLDKLVDELAKGRKMEKVIRN